MNREQKRKQQRQNRLLAKQRAMSKEQDMEELDVDAEETESIEKDDSVFYPSDMVRSVDVQPLPTSFEELDALRLARDEADAIREVTWDVEDLVRNILNSPTLDHNQKVEAMNSVVGEFENRVSAGIDNGDIAKELDMDLLELEAMVSDDKRGISIIEETKDFVTKAVLTSSKRNSLPDSAFAFVVVRNGKKIRKYPIHDKAHIRAALSYGAKMMAKGGPDGADAKTAMPKIHAAAKNMGIGKSIEKDANAIIVEKDANNNWRWVGWASNNFEDRDGDIISEKAHLEYEKWWDEHKEISPVFDTWHIPGTARKNPVDFLMYEKGFLILSGKLEVQEAAALLNVQKEMDIGLSVAAFATRDPKDQRIINQYRLFAVSDLPLNKAANPFTDVETLSKEVVDMNKRDYLAKIMGSEEKADTFLEQTGLKQKALQEAEVESKEKETETAPVDPPVEPPAESHKETEIEKKEETSKTTTEIVSELMKAMDIEGLNAFVTQAKEAMEKVEVLENLVKNLQGEQDEKLAEKISPPVSLFAWSQEKRASQSQENLVDTEEKKKNAPGVPEGYWLSDVTGTSPIKAK